MHKEKEFSREVIAANKRVGKEKEYWLNNLAGELVKTNFYYDYPRRDPGDHRVGALEFSIPAGLSPRLLHLANNADNNLYVILLAALNALLNLYTGNTDLIVTAPIYKQPLEGEFLNTVLILRNRLNEATTFKELLLQTKNTLISAVQHLNYPVDKLLPHLHISSPGSSADSFLFETVILLENIQERKYIQHLKPNILFCFRREEDNIEGRLEYNVGLYKKETGQRLIAHFIAVLAEIVENLSIRVSDLEILSSQERRRLLLEFNDTGAKFPGDKTVKELFEQQVETTPHHIAVVYEDNRITYEELNENANRLGQTLRLKGESPAGIVGLWLEPSLERIIGIMAVIKSGSIYLPLEPGMPGNRVMYMLNDSKAGTLLISNYSTPDRDIAERFQGDIIHVDGSTLVTESPGDHNLITVSTPADLVYLIYTSGTTGNPKGVLVKNESLVNYVNWFAKEAELGENDNTLLASSFAFDLSYTSLYSAILKGCQLHVLAKEIYLDAGDFLNYIQNNKITYIKVTPSLFTLIVNHAEFSPEKCKSLRLAICGGEEINLADLERSRDCCPHLRIMNHYGPTETTIGSVAQLIDFRYFDRYKEAPTIGQPAANTRVYILDRNLNPLPLGAVGELYIAGSGVARGYLNNPDLTADRFCLRRPGGARVYRQGGQTG